MITGYNYCTSKQSWVIRAKTFETKRFFESEFLQHIGNFKHCSGEFVHVLVSRNHPQFRLRNWQLKSCINMTKLNGYIKSAQETCQSICVSCFLCSPFDSRPLAFDKLLQCRRRTSKPPQKWLENHSLVDRQSKDDQVPSHNDHVRD